MDIIIILILAIILVLVSDQKIIALLCLIIIYLLLKPKIQNEKFTNPLIEIPQEEYNMRPIDIKKYDFDTYNSFDSISRGKNAEKSRIGTNTNKVDYLERFYGDVLNYNGEQDWWNNKKDNYNAMYNFYK